MRPDGGMISGVWSWPNGRAVVPSEGRTSIELWKCVEGHLRARRRTHPGDPWVYTRRLWWQAFERRVPMARIRRALNFLEARGAVHWDRGMGRVRAVGELKP
jgi:hypothetical protein